MNQSRLIAVDWGTTSLRGALLDPDGAVLAERSVARGILSVASGEFREVLMSHFGDWLRGEHTLCLIAGMAGSRQGWVEAPYCACPAGFAEVAAQVRWIEPGRVAIVPGLSCDDAGVPDVMRGEETQIFGALALLGVDAGVLVLPGTHCKWVRVEAGRIAAFETVMTGEIYALLRQHSILARSMPAHKGEDPATEALDGDAFDQGVRHALRGSGLMHSVFSTRTLALFGRLPAERLPSYLSGVVIGEEMRAQAAVSVAEVIVIGASGLTERYRRALALRGIATTMVGPQASWRGLHALAAALRAAAESAGG